MRWNKHDDWLIKHGYQMNINQNEITEWTRETKSVPKWWADLLQGKQISVNKHRIITCMSWSEMIRLCMTINQSINQSINQ